MELDEFLQSYEGEEIKEGEKIG